MNKLSLTILLLTTISTGSLGCYNPTVQAGVVGGAAGAGVGAAVGAASSAHTVPQAMGIGAAIGVPVGIAGYYIADAAHTEYVRSQYEKEIRTNNNLIAENTYDIEKEEASIRANEPEIMPDKSRAKYVYVGQKLGNPR